MRWSLLNLLLDCLLVSLVLEFLLLPSLSFFFLISAGVLSNSSSECFLLFKLRVFTFLLKLYLHIEHVPHRLSFFFTALFNRFSHFGRRDSVETVSLLVWLTQFLFSLLLGLVVEARANMLSNCVHLLAASVGLMRWSIKEFSDVVFTWEVGTVTASFHFL